MDKAPELHMKENETFILDCMITDGNKTCLVLSNLDVKAEIRFLSGQLFQELAVDVSQGGIGKFVCRLATENLKSNTYWVDIKFEHLETGLKIVTMSFKLVVHKGITI